MKLSFVKRLLLIISELLNVEYSFFPVITSLKMTIIIVILVFVTLIKI